MGSGARQRGHDRQTVDMFDMPAVQDSIVRIDTPMAPITSPVWSENKARLIQKYVRYFILITKHGTYIDAFAGPQVERFNNDSWSAKLVLEIQPNWLRRFILCEVDPHQLSHLQTLLAQRRAEGDRRAIDLIVGNCNATLPQALSATPIKPSEATFCLLDQRTFECDWRTVQLLSAHKTIGKKIELFYFLPVGWLHRSMSALKNDEPLVRWWGLEDVDALRKTRNIHETATLFTDRFRRDLGYRSVNAWPIFERGESGKIMYFMIHAADHEEAPRLMNRAYRHATGALEPMEHLQLELDGAGFKEKALT